MPRFPRHLSGPEPLHMVSIQGGHITLGSSVRLPPGTVWTQCRIAVGPRVHITVAAHASLTYCEIHHFPGESPLIIESDQATVVENLLLEHREDDI